jgi:hypothetical protein
MLIDFPMLLSAPMHSLVTASAKSYQIGFDIIALLASRLNVMNLKTFHTPARLATPSISLQDFLAELAISIRVKPQSWPLGTDPSQSVTCTFSRSCFLSGFGRPITSRVREGNRAFRFPTSKLTPAGKSAQIISKQ